MTTSLRIGDDEFKDGYLWTNGVRVRRSVVSFAPNGPRLVWEPHLDQIERIEATLFKAEQKLAGPWSEMLVGGKKLFEALPPGTRAVANDKFAFVWCGGSWCTRSARITDFGDRQEPIAFPEVADQLLVNELRAMRYAYRQGRVRRFLRLAINRAIWKRDGVAAGSFFVRFDLNGRTRWFGRDMTNLGPTDWDFIDAPPILTPFTFDTKEAL